MCLSKDKKIKRVLLNTKKQQPVKNNTCSRFDIFHHNLQIQIGVFFFVDFLIFLKKLF